MAASNPSLVPKMSIRTYVYEKIQKPVEPKKEKVRDKLSGLTRKLTQKLRQEGQRILEEGDDSGWVV